MNFQEVREAFDKTAPSMDTVVVRNPINAWMRQVNQTFLLSSFPSGGRLLELGCGTGEEAIRLASRGHTVLALDISEGMVAKAREKVHSRGFDDRVRVLHGRMSDLVRLVQPFFQEPFDGAYASFSLTYEPDLRSIAESLYQVIAKGAVFLCTMPNKIVLSELLIYGSMLRFGRMTWRFKRPLWMEIEGHQLMIHAYSPAEVVDAFEEFFELESLVGIPTFLPPVYLHAYFKKLGWGQAVLKRLDMLLSQQFPWNHLGDHSLFKFRRLNSTR